MKKISIFFLMLFTIFNVDAKFRYVSYDKEKICYEDKEYKIYGVYDDNDTKDEEDDINYYYAFPKEEYNLDFDNYEYVNYGMPSQGRKPLMFLDEIKNEYSLREAYLYFWNSLYDKEFTLCGDNMDNYYIIKTKYDEIGTEIKLVSSNLKINEKFKYDIKYMDYYEFTRSEGLTLNILDDGIEFYSDKPGDYTIEIDIKNNYLDFYDSLSVDDSLMVSIGDDNNIYTINVHVLDEKEVTVKDTLNKSYLYLFVGVIFIVLLPKKNIFNN